MATIHPFAALLPAPELAPRICELPYDVMSSEEARSLAADNPHSFLHVSKPEIDLPPGTDLHSPEVYARGRDNFRRLIAEGTLVQDSRPSLYLYRQVMGTHSQVGIVATASCQEYLDGVIKKHEFTRPDKEDDRVRHIEALAAQTGPVFLTYHAQPAIDAFVAQRIQGTPLVDFTAPDGVRHTSWRLETAGDVAFLSEAFQRVPYLYIADGHHRSAAAARVYQARGGAGNSDRFLTVLFPGHQMQILPYNRVLEDLNGLTPEALLARLAGICTLTAVGQSQPTRKHELGLYLSGRWLTLLFRPEFTSSGDAIDRLDVSLLQRLILEPLLGIKDPRTSDRIQFVGGIRGTRELEQRVDGGEFACAFSLFPTSIQDLMSIADAGGIMPPKSTWFEPKLRDAMFCHLI